MKSQVVVVSGAAGRMGRHLTKCLLEMGYRVAALDLDVSPLTALVEAHPSALRCQTVDVRSPAQVQRAIRTVLAEWGKIDILVNNSAVAVLGAIEEKPLDQIRREFELNYFGYLHLIRAVLPFMKARGFGIIHNVSSDLGLTGLSELSSYTSTRGAMESLTTTLRHELRTFGVAVTLMRTPPMRPIWADRLGIPFHTMADPEDVARKLARRVLSTSAVVGTWDTTEALWSRMTGVLSQLTTRLQGTPSERALPGPRPQGRMTESRWPVWNP